MLSIMHVEIETNKQEIMIEYVTQDRTGADDFQIVITAACRGE